MQGDRIRNIDPGDDEQIKKTLRYVFALVGLKPENMPDELQKMVLINYIRNDLGKYTLDEIKLAFHMAISGELACDPNHYQSFSPMYIAQIMQSYSKERIEAVKHQKRLIEEKEPEMSESEKKELHVGFLRSCIITSWKTFLKTGSMTFGITPMRIIYKIFTEDLKAFEYTEDEKRIIYDQALIEIKDELEKKKQFAATIQDMRNLRHINDLIGKSGIEIAMQDDIKSMCYKLSILQYFRECQMNEIDFEQLVEKHIQMMYYLNTINPNK